MKKSRILTCTVLLGGLSGCYAYYPASYPPYYPPNGYPPPPAYTQNAAPPPFDTENCRESSQSAVVDGKMQKVYGTACRQPDGSWRTVSEEGPGAIPGNGGPMPDNGGQPMQPLLTPPPQ